MVIIDKFCDTYDRCPECDGYTVYIIEKGETVCSQCGLIIFERELDLSHSGKRAFAAKEKEKSINYGWMITPLLADIELCSKINRNETNDYNLQRVIKRNSIYSWKTRNMLIAISEIKRLSDNLKIPAHLKSEALMFYKKCYKANILRGRSITGMVAACLYYVCRKMNYPVFLIDIINESSSEKELIKKCYTILIKKFNLNGFNIDPIKFIPRFIAELGLSIEIEQLTIKILKYYLDGFKVKGKQTRGLCAGAIYLAAKLKYVKITQKIIVERFGIAEITLRARYKEILKIIKY